VDEPDEQPLGDEPRLRVDHRVEERAVRALGARGIGIVPRDGVVGQQAHGLDVAAAREVLERAHADVAGRDARQHRAGQPLLAHDGVARRDRRQRARGRNAERRHRLAHEVLAQHRPDAPRAVAAARERRAPRALELDVAAHARPVDHLAEQDGPAVAQLRHEHAELVPRVRRGDGLGSRRGRGCPRGRQRPSGLSSASGSSPRCSASARFSCTSFGARTGAGVTGRRSARAGVRRCCRRESGWAWGLLHRTRAVGPRGTLMQMETPSATSTIELGLDTFGDVTTGPDGLPHPQAQVIRARRRRGGARRQVGLAFFGVGEHHRPDFAVSAPEVVLAAIAARTTRIPRLGRDGAQHRRPGARVPALLHAQRPLARSRRGDPRPRIVHRVVPALRLRPAQYERLFEEKLERFASLLAQQADTWSGARAARRTRRVYPPVESGRLRAWVGVGGSPESVVRAARYDLPLMLAIIGGNPARFAPFVQLYRRALASSVTPTQPVGAHSPGHVAETDEQARADLWPHYQAMMSRIGAERGWPPVTRAQFEREAGPDGALFVGAPETVARKIVATVEALGLSRFDMKYSNGALPHDTLLTSIELYGTRVVPLVRDALEHRAPAGRHTTRAD
jgi:alkanesulfonate monooxygenase SsuD/methylene tetrahydromethanopterin reductase-like flavin-dependent oxidoreductase (luciferase family)